MNVTKAEQPVDDLYEISGIARGSIYIATEDNGRLTSALADGLPVVLCTQQDGRLELTTRAKIDGVPTAPGTYLNADDLASLNDRSLPLLRLYTWHDTFAKVRSAGGVALLLPALIALLTAITGIFFLLSSQGQPPATTVADQA
jgi:hypothetical protein